MLSAQGLAQDPNFILVLVALAIIAIVWWRVVLILIAITLMVILGLGAIDLFHDMYHAVGR
jgi:uncharacterized membrane protein